ncbi:MAG: hypothetical protein LRZ94_00915 [Candidatus Pacebacteria bacterium]|nr:hypothetical protein [Candidatus Paceibacterota bacterium]
MLKFPSKKTIDEQRPEFALLPQDDYELKIIDVLPDQQNQYMAKPDPKTGKIPQVEVMNFTFEVVAFKDGSQAVDVDGKDATGRKVFFTGRQNKDGEWTMGFQNDGTASKLRQLVCYATNQDIEEEVELEAWEQLLGKTIYAEIVKYTTQKGDVRNKIGRFLPAKKEREKIKKEEEIDIPIVEDEG